MNLLKWLRRLGILRYGAEGAVYHDANERPLSLQQDNIFDSKRDVTPIGKQSQSHSSTDHAARGN